MGYRCHTFTKCADVAVGREESGNFGIGDFERYFSLFCFVSFLICVSVGKIYDVGVLEFSNIFFPLSFL